MIAALASFASRELPVMTSSELEGWFLNAQQELGPLEKYGSLFYECSDSFLAKQFKLGRPIPKVFQSAARQACSRVTECMNQSMSNEANE